MMQTRVMIKKKMKGGKSDANTGYRYSCNGCNHHRVLVLSSVPHIRSDHSTSMVYCFGGSTNHHYTAALGNQMVCPVGTSVLPVCAGVYDDKNQAAY